MQKTIGIYKIENLINGKCYIGQSKDVGRRWTIHKYHSVDSSYPDYDYPLYRAFRKYGLDNFSFSIIEECEISRLNERELYWIEYYNAKENGYNQKEGGQNIPANRKLTDDEAFEIIKLLKNTNLSQEEIGMSFNVSRHIVSNINQGNSYIREGIDYPIRKPNEKQESYCVDCGKKITYKSLRCIQCSNKMRKTEKPVTREELKKLIRTETFVSIGQTYNVSDTTIRKWCKGYNLPYKAREIKKISDEVWEKL